MDRGSHAVNKKMRSLYDNVLVSESLAVRSDTGGSAVNGSAVDTMGYNTAMLLVNTAIASGSPTAASMVVKLQESDTSGGTYADALDNTGTAIGFTLDVKTAVQQGQARIEGLGTNRKRYLRITETTTFTGGTSPAVLLHGLILLGAGYSKPANTTASNT